MYKEEDDLPAVKAAWESTVRIAQQHPHPFRRRSCIFSSMLVTTTAGDDTSTTPKEDQVSENPNVEEEQENVYQAERLLANGDFYMGQWSGNLPDGPGKYLWTDGCMYEGEWHQGKTTGKGKFSWPSGATYEGEFKSGFMDGFGTYTGSAGDTYRGSWSMNLKHGSGKKHYANGDYFDGEWRAGLQDGHGRYVWRNGNEYIGQWRSGAIHGRGSLIWSNGNRYDGGWEDGLPRGNGSFRWADGSLYIGFWSRDAQKGVYYPSPAANSPTARDPQVFFAADLGDCKVCPSDNVSVLPSQKSLNWLGIEADFLLKQAVWRSTKASSDQLPRRQSSLDAIVATETAPTSRRPNGHSHTVIGTGGDFVWQVEGEEFAVTEEGKVDVGGASDGGIGEEEVETRGLGTIQQQVETRGLGTIQQQLQQMKGQAREMRKQGETISKGHKNYDLMLNLQLGIRHAVGKQAQSPVTSLDLRASAFDPKEKVWTKFPPEGSKHTPPHQSCDFKWKDYCPLVFRTLRRLFKVDAGEYMISICGDDALRELSSPGKSGSFFYLTNDDRYMIKTVKKSEVKVLLRMLPAYYNHVRAFENTLVTKFFGLHCVKLTGATQKKVRFVIMGNLFCSEYVIHRRFDLKGSSHGRTTDKSQAEIDENTTLKDLDLNFIFRLQKSWFQEFCRQVDRDCELLEQERIMDYSLLVGVHFREIASPTDASLIDASFSPDNADVEATPRLSRVDMDQFLCDPTRWATIRLGINMPARVEQIIRTECDSLLIGEPTGEFYDVIVFFGIIDILQDYDISKKLEHAYKSIQYDPTSISAVDPKQYAKRFRDFIFRVFTEDT